MFGGLHIEMAALRSLEHYWKAVAGPVLLLKQGWLRLVQQSHSWLSQVLPGQDWPTRLQQAACTDWWKNPIRSTALNLKDWCWSLKNCVSSTDVRVHSSNSGIWCWTWSLSYSCWLWTLLWSTLWTDPLLLCKQQYQLCSVASSSPQGHDVSWAAASRGSQGVSQRKLCCS